MKKYIYRYVKKAANVNPVWAGNGHSFLFSYFFFKIFAWVLKKSIFNGNFRKYISLFVLIETPSRCSNV